MQDAGRSLPIMKKKESPSPSSKSSLHRHWSGPMLDGDERAPSRAMLYAVGFQQEDFQNPSRHCLHLEHGHAVQHAHRQTRRCEARKASMPPVASPLIFNTITISDGISMGTEGMKYSLVSAKSLPIPSRPSWVARASTALSPSAAATKICQPV